jgi:hypothetical protein
MLKLTCNSISIAIQPVSVPLRGKNVLKQRHFETITIFGFQSTVARTPQIYHQTDRPGLILHLLKKRKLF